jgi:hypothetical protein
MDFEKAQKRGVIFGESRDKFNHVYIPENPVSDRSVPGPGSYMANPRVVQKGVGAFTMKGRHTHGSSKVS